MSSSSPSSPSIPSTHLAWTYTSRGAPRSVLKLSSLPTPPQPLVPTKLLIQVTHAALNPGAAKLLRMMPWPLPNALRTPTPSVPELECAGIIAAMGSAAPKTDARGRAWGVGTRVVVPLDVPRMILKGEGALREFVLVEAGVEGKVLSVEGALALEGLEGAGQEGGRKGLGVRLDEKLAEGSGLSGAGQTAMKMCDLVGVKDGMRVVVNGVSGSTGLLAMQMALRQGATVVGVCSGRNEEMVRAVVEEMGAGFKERLEAVVDYTKYEGGAGLGNELTKRFGNGDRKEGSVDAVLDCVGTIDLYYSCAGFLKRDGLYVNIGAFEGMLKTILWWTRALWVPQWLGGGDRKFVFFSNNIPAEGQVRLMDMWEKGDIKVGVDNIYDMEDALDAFDRIESKRSRGKVVVRVRDLRSL